MGKKDLTEMLGGGGGRTRQKYKCKADGCQVTSIGVNLSKHYKVNTDWFLVKELKACVGDEALQKKLDQTDPHTRYRILGMQISNFRYANMDFFKTPHIQIRFL